MLSPPTKQSVFVLPNFNSSDCVSEQDDSEVYYQDIMQSMNDDSKYKLFNRRRFIISSQEKAHRRLYAIYQEKLEKLAEAQKQQIADLKLNWLEARQNAEMNDMKDIFEAQQTTKILTICGNYEKAVQIHNNMKRGERVKRCDEKFMSLLTTMKHRHEAEIDAITSNYASEMELANSEHEVLHRQIENQYMTDVASNTTEIVNMISASNKPVQDKERLIKSVSPQKGKRLSGQRRVVNSAFTPIPKYRLKI